MKVYIIAEAGVNHNGSLIIAKKLVDEAKIAGADCIKFQTFISENLVSQKAEKADYQKINTSSSESQLDMLKKLELSFDDFVELHDYCLKKEIEFLSTAFDFDSINFLHGLGLNRWKVPSGDITNLPYLTRIAKLKKPVILSTGMSTMEDIEQALKVLTTYGAEDITILHCTTEYPVPYKDVNLKAMGTIREAFGYPVGYSDHTAGIEISLAAVALGATVIEKHFTLDNDMYGPDHKASITPEQLKQLVDSVRYIELALGTDVKAPVISELKNKEVARKSIVAKHAISKGALFSEDNLTVKRPGNGLSPMRWYEVIGREADKNYEEEELIEL